jgi:SAM-dependent methyltransferase
VAAQGEGGVSDIVLVDPVDRRSGLTQEDDVLVSVLGNRYPIAHGIPRFVGDVDPAQAQTADSFGYKWTRHASWGQRADDGALVWELWRELYGFEGPHVLERLMRDRVVLDAGSGSGVALRRFMQWPRAIAAADISRAIDACQDELAGRAPITFVQADLHHLPFPDASFDVVWSAGVLHHTPDTYQALAAVTRHVKQGGHIVFYVYVKKAPIREFVDDYLRRELSALPPAEAWTRLEALTAFGRSLAAIDQPLVIEQDVPELGFRAGTYNLQRFAYYNLFKCFWNDALSFDENVHVNFDWYHPAYAHRHTPEDVRGWLRRLGLVEESFFVGESGITVIARRDGDGSQTS